MEDAIEAFADHIIETKLEDIPSDVIKAAKTCILDTIGVGLAGSIGPYVEELVSTFGNSVIDPKNFARVIGQNIRLSPGKEVRLRYAYLIRCKEVVKDTEGKIIELRCTYDPETKGGSAPDGRKVKGILHWVSSHDAINAEIRFYSKLFNTEQPGKSGELIDDLNKESILIHKNCKLEPSLLKFGCEETV